VSTLASLQGRSNTVRPLPPADLVKTLEGEILRLSGFANRYSQVKWIFSIKMATHKALVLFKLHSHAKRVFFTFRAHWPRAAANELAAVRCLLGHTSRA
jgi:hypothetical protein